MAPRGWAKGYFLSTTCRHWNTDRHLSRRNKKPNIGWKGRECRIAIGQNAKSEIPTCESADTLEIFSLNTFWNLRASISSHLCKEAEDHFHNGHLLRDGNFAAISDLHLPNLPQIASCAGLAGDAGTNMILGFGPSWAFASNYILFPSIRTTSSLSTSILIWETIGGE